MTHRPRRPTFLLALLAAAACTAPGASGGRFAGPWESPRLRDHPLVGKVWDVAGARLVDEAELVRAVRGAELVLLGEVHDNADHHLLQARLLRAMVEAGRRPAVAFEMLDPDQAPPLEAFRATGSRDPDALAQAVGWATRGWPPFALYRPIFAAALEAELPIVAANLPRRAAHALVTRGPAALEPEARALLEGVGPLGEATEGELRQEMSELHCGAVPASMLGGFVVVQRARDATLAARLLAAAGRDGAVLVTGSGHARKDRGVPVHLAHAPAPRSVLSVAFVEVEAGVPEPDGYPLPYDYAVFTPRAEREDPCAELRRRVR